MVGLNRRYYETVIFAKKFIKSNKRILIKEYGIKTSDNQIIITNYGDLPASVFYIQLDKFGKSIKRLDISNVNSKYIKFGYFKCNYSN